MRIHFIVFLLLLAPTATPAPGEWPEPRQNPELTAWQPLAGAMTQGAEARAVFDLGRTQAAITPVAVPGSERFLGLAVVAGELQCYEQSGQLRWKSHPPGLNFESIAAARDLDGDGRVEVLLQAGRSAMPYGAAVLVDLETGAVRWRYDVEPMSYAWYLYAGSYVPGAAHEQIIVLMHAYPPDPKNGYIAMFEFGGADQAPAQRWRYDFDQYTCFPSLLQTDLDADGKRELVVETHSRMWFLDAETGAMKHFAQWDVSPANVRSYGFVKFVDLNGDQREDFLCIADFSQHHEVLLNQDGKFVEAWHQGWQESVTTGKVATTWPEPPYADVDGDGNLEMLVSMFNSEGKPEWLLRVYDAVTGVLEYRVEGVVATATGDIDGDGRAEILGNRCAEPTRNTLDGAVLLRALDGQLASAWEKQEATARLPREDGGMIVREGEARFALRGGAEDAVTLEAWTAPPAAPPPDFSAVPSTLGPPPPQVLAANLLPGPENELVLYHNGAASILSFREGQFVEQKKYDSSCLPVTADLDGDGTRDLALASVSPTTTPRVRVVCPAQDDRVVWDKELPPTERSGLPAPRAAYLRSGRFTGGATPDLYFWAGTPMVRSVVLNGRTGEMVWDHGEVPGNERYWGPSMNLASVLDFDADGTEDLVFTNPDYYCVGAGATGALLLGPLFPPRIFDQPSQGLYTLPAILNRAGNSPLVALVSGHYFQGVMTLAAERIWHKVPGPGEARQGAEGFLQNEQGEWLMGFGRQSGVFACVNVADGTVRWELDVAATASDIIACDVDGDGRAEFVFGTSHGELVAVGDGGSGPRVVWRAANSAALGAPIAADIDADGASEIIAPAMDGRVMLFDTMR